MQFLSFVFSWTFPNSIAVICTGCSGRNLFKLLPLNHKYFNTLQYICKGSLRIWKEHLVPCFNAILCSWKTPSTESTQETSATPKHNFNNESKKKGWKILLVIWTPQVKQVHKEMNNRTGETYNPNSPMSSKTEFTGG